MTARSKLGLVALLGVIAIGVLLVLRQNPNQNASLAATPTSSEGELAAAAAGAAKYSHYFPTVEECNRAVDNKEVENCVAPDSIKQVTRPEWTQLFSHTDFYVIGLLGRHEVEIYDNSYRRDLVAWQDGRAYSAETFDTLLKANDIVVTDTNRELVAKALVLMTLPDYLEKGITFSDSENVDEPGVFSFERFNYTLTAWTELQGLKIPYLFFFQQGQLRIALWKTSEYGTGTYIDVPSGELSPVQHGELRFQQ
jgi:hypothetical protein